MSRWDRPSARVVLARSAAPLRVGNAELGHVEKRQGGWTWCRQRLSEIEALIDHRTGVDEADPADYLWAARWSLLWIRARPGCPSHQASLEAWTNFFLPGLLEGRRSDWLADVEAEARGQERCPYRRADSIANLLRVTWEEKLTLSLRTIGCIDMSAAQRKKERRKADAAYQRARREQMGAAPRSKSQNRARPWEKEGISRRTWFRRRAALGTTSSATSQDADTETSASSGTHSPPESGGETSPIWHRGTVSSGLGYGVSYEHRRDGAIDPPAGKRRPEAGGRRQAGKSVDRCSTPPAETPANERSEIPSMSPQATCPAGEAARAASATTSPPAQPSAEADELRVGLPTTSPADGNRSAKLRHACERWTRGPAPELVRQAFVAAKRRRGLKQPDVAKAIGVEVRDLAGADHPGTRLRPAAIERLKVWLLAQDLPQKIDPWAGLRSPEKQAEWEARQATIAAAKPAPAKPDRLPPAPPTSPAPKISARKRREHLLNVPGAKRQWQPPVDENPAIVPFAPAWRNPFLHPPARVFGQCEVVEVDGRPIGETRVGSHGLWIAIHGGQISGHYRGRRKAADALRLLEAKRAGAR